MWKRRLIAVVTFLAGLYYFLEFVVPPTIPWQSVSGRVLEVTPTEIRVQSGAEVRSIGLEKKILIFRQRVSGTPERVEPQSLSAGDTVTIGPSTYLSDGIVNVNNFFIVLSTMAWGMGLISLWLQHSTAIRKKSPEWYGSIIFFIAMVAGCIAGYGSTAEAGWTKETYDVVFNYVLRPAGSTVFSLLAFYMASAAYRAFKIKSREALLMMASALIVLIGQTPFGSWLTQGFPEAFRLPAVAQWILYLANSGAVRGMWFGMMLGAIAVGLRFWLSLERGAYFDME